MTRQGKAALVAMAVESDQMEANFLRATAEGRRRGLLQAATLARDHDIGEDAYADRALDTLAEKLERLAGEIG